MLLLAAVAVPVLGDTISATEIYRDTQVTDSDASRRLIAGGNEILRWTYLLLKLVAIAAIGWGTVQAFSGDVRRMLRSFLIALVLFFVPQVIDLAEGLARWSNRL